MGFETDVVREPASRAGVFTESRVWPKTRTELSRESLAARAFRAGEGEFRWCIGNIVRLLVHSHRRLCLQLGQQIGVEDGKIRYGLGLDGRAPVFECRVEPSLFANGADKRFVGLPCGGDAPRWSVGDGSSKTPALNIGQRQVGVRRLGCLTEERRGEQKGRVRGAGIVGEIGEDSAERRVDLNRDEEAEEVSLRNREVEELDEVLPKRVCGEGFISGDSSAQGERLKRTQQGSGRSAPRGGRDG